MTAGPAGSEESDALSAALKALSHPKRLRLLRFLVEPRYLEEIASELSLARQSAQEHVDQLLALGMIEPRRGKRDYGPVTEYVVVLPRLFEIHEQLGTRLGLLRTEIDEDVHVTRRTSASPDPGSPTAPAADGPRLTIVHGMRVGQTIPLEGAGPWLLGRDPLGALCLDYDPFVSTRHAEVRRSANGFELADAFSSNGTFVDWKRLPRGGVVALPSGSLVRLGKTLLHFRTRA